MWNGEAALAQDIVADQLTRHLPGGRVQSMSRAELVGRIAQLRASCPNPGLVVGVGPVLPQGMVVGRWALLESRAGHVRGTSGDAGDEPRRQGGSGWIAGGADMLRIVERRVVECWTSCDLTAVAELAREPSCLE
ncbi:MAG: hypothetical protein HKP61_18200 [Dactylosporangium sp.]|nr:hypothetical protein [Dactylosporangium sp.]NNJ62830.1 hypothetical protein [Dactylosporangium sp.]